MPRAERDLESIFLYIRAGESEAASRWFAQIVTAIESLSEMPGRCPAIKEAGGLHHLLYGNKPHVYRIIFAIDKDLQRVNVLHGRHGARGAFSA